MSRLIFANSNSSLVATCKCFAAFIGQVFGSSEPENSYHLLLLKNKVDILKLTHSVHYVSLYQSNCLIKLKISPDLQSCIDGGLISTNETFMV